MHMTKHVFGVYSTEPGTVSPPDQARIQADLDAAHPAPADRRIHEGEATVAAY